MNTQRVLRDYTKCVYYAGVGDYWYEKQFHETKLYKAYKYISFGIYTIMIFLENIAAFFGSFPDVEKNSAVMFAAIHNIVLAKMFLLLYHKSSVRKLNLEMANVGNFLEEETVMRKQYRKVKWGILAYVVSVYASLTAYGVESARKMIVEATPFYTVVTYYPTYNDQSTFASFFRVFFYITWLYMMLPMMSTDCYPITHVITLTYKFITLRHHFERIREVFDSSVKVKSEEENLKKLKAGFLDGILMHQKLLSLADEIHRVFGIIMSLQVCESSAVAVLLLLRLTLSPRMTLSNAFMTYTFVGSLFLLLALNLWNAGEITHQASLLSSAMFYSGWHLTSIQTPAHQDIRRLVMIGCAQAQKPLVLKAFGIQDLSYATFVSVAKATYSIVAVFYDRGDK